MGLAKLLPDGISIRFRRFLTKEEKITRNKFKIIFRNMNSNTSQNNVDWEKYNDFKKNLINRVQNYQGKYKSYFESKLKKLQEVEDFISKPNRVYSFV